MKSNKFQIQMDYNEKLSYNQFESLILTAISYNYNIIKHSFNYGYVIYDLNSSIGIKKYNIIILYPYIEKNVSFKYLYETWISNNNRSNLHIIAKTL